MSKEANDKRLEAQQALDKMAENARELRLDYEQPAPVAEPRKQEPVAWVCYGAPGKRDIDFEEADINGLPIGTLLYTSPPAQRTWVGLTIEEIAGVVSLAGFAPDWVEAHIAIQIVKTLEAKLKEKNT